MILALPTSMEVAGLPKHVRDEIDHLTNVMTWLREAVKQGGKMTAYEAAAHQLTCNGRKYTTSGVRNLFREWKNSGFEPMYFKDGRKIARDGDRPAAFVEWVRKRAQRHGRSFSSLYQDIISEWRSGAPIPGYPVSPPAAPYSDVPFGWGESNLRKLTKTSDFEKAAMRVGLGYAKAKHGPKHFHTRADLYHLSHIMPDDVEHDNFVYVDTKRQTCRVAQIGMLDVFSGNYFCYGTRPMLKRWDSKQRKFVTDGIKEANMRFLLAAQLYNHGYSPQGTSYPAELGAATIRDDIARILHDRTKAIHGEALLTVDLSGWTGKKQIVDGMFIGRGGGNPRHKAPLESLHNLLHNRLGALPGQTGPDVERRPEQLHGMLNAQNQLMAVAGMLSPWAAKKLQYPLLEYTSEFCPVLAAFIDAINRRRNHNLEGWHELKFITDEYRFHRESQEWLSQDQYLALPEDTRRMLSKMVKDDNALHRPSRLSPHEVFAMKRGGAVRAHISMIAEILYADLAVERKCRNGYFEFDDQEISPELLRFDSRITTPDAREEELTDDKYEVVINPFQPDLLWVYSGRGAFLGTARRTEKSSRVNREQRDRNLGHLQKRYADLAAPLAKRHADLAREETKRLQNNIDVIEGPQSEVEAQLERDRADRAHLLPAPAPVTLFVEEPAPDEEPPSFGNLT